MINFRIPVGEGIQTRQRFIVLGIPDSEGKGVRNTGASGHPDKWTFPAKTGPGVRKTGRLLNLAPSCNVPDDRTGLRGRQKKRTSIQETQTVYDLSSYRSLFYTAILVTGRITAGMHKLFHGRSGDEI